MWSHDYAMWFYDYVMWFHNCVTWCHHFVMWFQHYMMWFRCYMIRFHRYVMWLQARLSSFYLLLSKSLIWSDRRFLRQCPLLSDSERSSDLKGCGALQFAFAFLCRLLVSNSVSKAYILYGLGLFHEFYDFGESRCNRVPSLRVLALGLLGPWNL